ncbi:MAG TPA: hypothetical protein VMM78_18580 [Thermomicrobiales bacterium]|nr:hypothetical protein [Thermomicrobiales bacterium]
MLEEDDDINPFEQPDFENIPDDEARESNQLMQAFLGVIALLIVLVLLMVPLFRILS